MPKQDTHTLILARWIIPVVPPETCLEDHALVIADERIVDLLPQAEAIKNYPQAKHAQLDHHIVIPGLINAHGHAAMTLLRGYSDDRELMDWLENHIWPVEGRFVDYDFAYDGTTLAIAEMIRTGTTCAVDTYFFPDATARAYTDHHFRAQVCLPVIQFSNAWAASEQEHIDKALALHAELKSNELVKTAFAPHAPYTVTDDALREIGKQSAQLDIPIHLHLHETATEVKTAVANSGQRPMARISALGLLSPRMQTVHMTQLSDEEISQLAECGAHVVHCPESNMKLASGLCRVNDLMQAGVNVALGSDGAASNNNLDMLEEMRSAALMAKVVAMDATALNAHEALSIATINGARMIGMEAEIGSLEIGKQADITAVDVSSLNFQPMHHPISQLVYTATGHQVTDVWIRGQRLLANREFTQLDADRLRDKVDQWFKRMQT
ncbi:MAG: TRZ/ATZ family hydrolase [Pseudomonadales bacterium]